jgi:hypothetical protein
MIYIYDCIPRSLPEHSIGVVEALEHSGCQNEIVDHFFPGLDQRRVHEYTLILTIYAFGKVGNGRYPSKKLRAKKRLPEWNLQADHIT